MLNNDLAALSQPDMLYGPIAGALCANGTIGFTPVMTLMVLAPVLQLLAGARSSGWLMWRRKKKGKTRATA